MRIRRLVVVAAIVILAVGALGGALLWTPEPPTREAQAAVATKLELVLPVLTDLGVNLWRDRYTGGCRHVSLTSGERFQDPTTGCGDATAFDSRAQAAWDRMAKAVADAVPGGRIQSVLEVDGTVTFIAVPRSLLGQDALVMRWTWTWSAASPTDPGLPSHWQFSADNAAIVRGRPGIA